MNSYRKSEIVLKQVEDIVARKNENGTVILMKMDDSDVFFKIDGIASRVWLESIDNGKEIGEIYEEILKDFDVEEETLNNDISNFIEELKKNNLILI